MKIPNGAPFKYVLGSYEYNDVITKMKRKESTITNLSHTKYYGILAT